MTRQMENAHAKQMLEFVTKTSLFVEDFCNHAPNQTGKLCKIMREQKEAFTTHDPNNVLRQEHSDEKFFNMDNSTYVFEEMDNSDKGIDFVKNYSPIFDIMWLLATINDEKAKKLIKSLDSTRSDFLICFKEEYRKGGGRPDYLLPQTILRLWRQFAKDAEIHEKDDVVNMSTNKNDFAKTEQKKYLAFLSLFEVSDGSRQFRDIFEKGDNNIFKKGIHDIQANTAGSEELSKIRAFLQHSEGTALQVLRDVSNMFGINMCVFSKVEPYGTMADECKPHFTNQYADTCFMLRFQNYGKRITKEQAENKGIWSNIHNLLKDAVKSGVESLINVVYGSLELRLVFALKTKRFVPDVEAEKQARQEAEEQRRRAQQEQARLDAIKQQETNLRSLNQTISRQTKKSEALELQFKTQQRKLDKIKDNIETSSSTLQKDQDDINKTKNELQSKEQELQFIKQEIANLTKAKEELLTTWNYTINQLSIPYEVPSDTSKSESPLLCEHKYHSLPYVVPDTSNNKSQPVKIVYDPSQDYWPTYTHTVYADSTTPTTPMCKADGSNFTTKDSLTKTIKSLSDRFKNSNYRDFDALSECCCAMIHKENFKLADIQLPKDTFNAMVNANPTMDWIMGLRGLAMSPAFGVIMTNLEYFEQAIDIVNQNGGFTNLHPGFAMFQDKIGSDNYSNIYKKIKPNTDQASQSSSILSHDDTINDKNKKLIERLKQKIEPANLSKHEQKSLYYGLLGINDYKPDWDTFSTMTHYKKEWPLTYSAFLLLGGAYFTNTIHDKLDNATRTYEGSNKKITVSCERISDKESPLGYKLVNIKVTK